MNCDNAELLSIENSGGRRQNISTCLFICQSPLVKRESRALLGSAVLRVGILMYCTFVTAYHF